jgi:hypothetical protein
MRNTHWAFLLLFSVACSPTGGNGLAGTTTCSQDADCGSAKLCLPNGSCGAQCSSDSQCGTGQKCSTGGACVATSACGSDTDCSGAQVCDTSSTCGAACTATSCTGGFVCNSVGHCSTEKPPANPSNPNVPASCGGELFEATPVQANFLIVLDHSGSMKELVGGQAKWTSAVSAVKNLTSANDATIRFGLNLFSFASPKCDPGRTFVQIGDNQADEIAAALPAVSDGSYTPLGGALSVASGNPGLVDPLRSNNVLVVTDGKENCGGKPVEEVKKIFGKSVKTYVIGFGGEVDTTMLSDMATEGGTARNGPLKYYQADDPTALNEALKAIARGAMGCDLKLKTPPADASKLYVYVNGSLQPRDPSKQDGWDYTAASGRITLYGTTCGLVTNDASAKVSIVYGCPDGSLVEGAPGSFCGANEQCSSGKCTAGLCEAPSGAKPGGAVCGGNTECASARCTNGRCELPNGGVQGGGACTVNTDCASGTCTRGICEGSQVGTPNGGACTSNQACASGNCVNNQCAPGTRPGGSACSNNAECSSGQCTNGFCESGLPAGSPCVNDSQCESGVCENNQCTAILG